MQATSFPDEDFVDPGIQDMCVVSAGFFKGAKRGRAKRGQIFFRNKSVHFHFFYGTSVDEEWLIPRDSEINALGLHIRYASCCLECCRSFDRCLWCGNNIALDKFSVGPIEEELPLSDEVQAMLNELSQWHDTSLNWDYPPDPGPWNADDYARFDEAAAKLLKSIQQELGEEFEVVYEKL